MAGNNGLPTARRPIDNPATQSDVVQASKALYDKLTKDLNERLEETGTDLSVRFGKALERETDKRLKELEESYAKRLHDEVARQADLFRSEVKALQEFHAKQLAALRKSYEDGVGLVKQLLQSIPTPQVNVAVPESAISVNVQHKTLLDLPEREIDEERKILYDPTSFRPDTVKIKRTEKAVRQDKETV